MKQGDFGLRIDDCGLKSQIRNPKSAIALAAECLFWGIIELCHPISLLFAIATVMLVVERAKAVEMD